MGFFWLRLCCRFVLLAIPFSTAFAVEVPIEDFPLTYSQSVENYLPSNQEDYQKELLSTSDQAKQLNQFFNHNYATAATSLSPWSESMVTAVLPNVKTIMTDILEDFNNQNKAADKIHYAENFKEHDVYWWNKIRNNMDLMRVDNLVFDQSSRAIATANTFARALPESAPDFYHVSIAGQGFPFDNLQESAIWVGTPLYVVSTSKDKAWSLVLTPDAYVAWVKSSDIAYVGTEFMHQWQTAARKKLVAVTKTDASISNPQGHFQFTGFIGSVFPFVERQAQDTLILIPVKDTHNQAMIETGVIESDASVPMPMPLTKKNIAHLLQELQKRPYGWGGAFFYNDCSSEMKNLFTPFGIWLPRNSAAQAALGATVDLSSQTPLERITRLKNEGHPLMTLIYIGGHVMLYVGNMDDEAITYQQVWGFGSHTQDKRYVIGQSVFFPLLNTLPNTDMKSQAQKSYFKLVYLDKINVNASTPKALSHVYLHHTRNVAQ